MDKRSKMVGKQKLMQSSTITEDTVDIISSKVRKLMKAEKRKKRKKKQEEEEEVLAINRTSSEGPKKMKKKKKTLFYDSTREERECLWRQNGRRWPRRKWRRSVAATGSAARADQLATARRNSAAEESHPIGPLAPANYRLSDGSGRSPPRSPFHLPPRKTKPKLPVFFFP